MADMVRSVRPRYVVVENVAALLRDVDAFGWLLGDLAELGFDAEWSVLPACAVGAPHTRERLFLVAYPNGGDGLPRMGTGATGPRPVPELSHRPRSWRYRVDGAVAASRLDDRETDGLARKLVKAGGNAVVPQVAELVGRLVMEHAAAREVA
jgi:DNA (cytosine-5)-methyltransferase 1